MSLLSSVHCRKEKWEAKWLGKDDVLLMVETVLLMDVFQQRKQHCHQGRNR
jgi:hypothetical protein